MWYKIGSIAILVLSAMSQVWGDTVVFLNGDQLHGKIVQADDKSVTMSTENFGMLNFSRSTVQGITYSEPRRDEQKVVAKKVAPEAPAPKGVATLESAPLSNAAATVEADQQLGSGSARVADDLEQLASEKHWALLWYARSAQFLEKINPLRRWESRFNFGFTLQEGATDRRDFVASFRTERKVDENAYRATARYEYGEQEIDGQAQRVTDNYQGELRWRHDLSTYVFTQTNSFYRSDSIQRIDHEAEQSFGIGWRLLETARFSASITPALTFRYQSFSSGTEDTATLGTLFQDFEYRINGTWSVHEEARVSIDPQTDGQQKYDFITRLEAKITDALRMNFRYEYQYDSELNSTIDNSQQKLMVGFGIVF